ncbi:unnamed protein product [Blepharisma stoltei]|uniref:Uncharacterized protein n=1 Tax=Blepharisma stoltei TaxID=1481888 RepID=A0AAU9J2F8_9CILI|nr:unnamed protein product [Blepharisma stoltei]
MKLIRIWFALTLIAWILLFAIFYFSINQSSVSKEIAIWDLPNWGNNKLANVIKYPNFSKLKEEISSDLNYYDDEDTIFPLNIACKPDSFGYTFSEAERWFPSKTYPRCESLYHSEPGMINIDFAENKLYMNCSGWYVLGPAFEEIGSMPFLKPLLPYENPVALTSQEYAFGTCDKSKSDNFEHFVYKLRPKDLALKRAENYFKGEKPLNIVMLVVDSLSRRQFFRKLPISLNFLKNLSSNYSFFDFKLNNVMGRNSHFFIMPALFGDIKYEAIYRPYREDYHTENSIWKKLHEKGFVSFFGSDGCVDSFSAFLGRAPKIDHIMGSVFCAAKRFYGYDQDLKSQRCIGNKNAHKIIMDQILQFSEAYKNVSRFSYAHINTNHESTGTVISTLDLDLADFLTDITSRNEDLVLFIKGDHGLREGGWFQTTAGANEHRIPLTFLIASNSFLEKIPNSLQILSHNTKRLISNFDFYNTLLSLGHPNQTIFIDNSKNTSRRYRSYNLFKDCISANRTCADIGIPLEWCSCLPVKNIDEKHLNDPLILMIANEVLLKINMINKCNRPTDACGCKYLSLGSIVKGGIVDKNNDVYFKITFTTNESKYAVFRTDVRLSKIAINAEGNDIFKSIPIKIKDMKYMKIMNVNRIDAYESKCVIENKLNKKDQMYCLCNKA